MITNKAIKLGLVLIKWTTHTRQKKMFILDQSGTCTTYRVEKERGKERERERGKREGGREGGRERERDGGKKFSARPSSPLNCFFSCLPASTHFCNKSRPHSLLYHPIIISTCAHIYTYSIRIKH